MRPSLRLALVAAAAVLTAAPAVASAQEDARVTVGSPPAPFSQNKQNEPAVAVDPQLPSRIAAGANDNIDMEACNAAEDNTCPFTDGVGVSGVYFSSTGFDWTQPTYRGLTARQCLGVPGDADPDCTPISGPIGTLPRYYEAGLVSDGDPALVFGPRRGADGRFAWANGSRLYYANLVSNLPRRQAFRGAEAIAVSFTDNFAGARAGSNTAWSPPVIVSRQSSATFSDKEEIWADNAASSPYFGNVYLCNVAFRGNGQGGGGEPLLFARSTNGGVSWTQRQITAATNNSQTGGRQGCAIRTDSLGRVYVYWVGTDIHTRGTVFLQARSDNGGTTFGQPQVVARLDDAGRLDPATGRFSFDGVAGARTSTFPSVDIANGAPTGLDATNEIVIVGTDAQPVTPAVGDPRPNERVLVRYSTNRGSSFADAPDASPASDRPDFPAVAISPDGRTVYVTYDNFLQPWQPTTAAPRLFGGVVRSAPIGGGGAPGAWRDRHRAPVGDARASSQNNLAAEFLGDYNYAFATRTDVTAVWNDARAGADCPAIDAYRQAYVGYVRAGGRSADEDLPEERAGGDDESAPPSGGPVAPEPPDVQLACPATFGNTDAFGGRYTP